MGTGLGTGLWPREVPPLTGLWRIMVTRFFCSIMLKSCRRSAAMFRARRYSGSSSAKPSR